MELPRNPTRAVRIGSVTIGDGHPMAVQSMTATHTQDVDATVEQVNALHAAGADVVRIAVDNQKDAAALAEIRRRTPANLSVDLQENYRLAAVVAPHVDEVRYNPGHLLSPRARKALAGQSQIPGRRGRRATTARCASASTAARSIRPSSRSSARTTRSAPMLASAWEHCELLDQLGFTRYCVSLKDSDPQKVIEVNSRFASSAARRAAAPGRDRGGPAARRHHQNPNRLRTTDQPRHRRHDSRFAHRAQRPQARGDRRRPADSGRHRRRPGAIVRRLRPGHAEHHQLP